MSVAPHHQTPNQDAGALAAAGAPIVDGSLARLTTTAFAAGAATGGLLGRAFGTGRIAIPRLGFLGADGPAVPAFVGAVAFGTVLALAVALSRVGPPVGSRAEREQEPGAERGGHESPHGGHTPTWVRDLPTYGALALVVAMGYTLSLILTRAFQAGTPSDQASRSTWQLKNVSRVGGLTDAETGPAALAVAYPATAYPAMTRSAVDPTGAPRDQIIMPSDWREALALAPTLAEPTRVGLVAPGTPGASGPPVADPAAVAAAVDERLSGARGTVSAGVIVAGMDADARWALPAATYAARTGTPILFVTRRGIPAPTQLALARRGGHATIYVLGPDDAVRDDIVEALARYGRVTRVAGGDVATNAVRFAEFYDPATGFGWGRTGRGPRQFASKNTFVVDDGRWQDAIDAAHLARRGKSGPLLFTSHGELPAAVENYLWRLRSRFAATPAEGPYAHATIVGSFARIPYVTQARIDYAEEIEQYMTLGDSAVSGFEALLIGWTLLSIASAIWIFVHSGRRLPDLMPVMRSAWALAALLLGPLAVWMYVASYHRRPTTRHDGMTTWQRSRWGQAISATVMMFGFDMLLMCLTVFWLAYRGFPIIRSGGPLYILGASMFLMMVGMYVVALALMLLVFHGPMTMHERKIPSYWKALAAGAPLMIATMTVESSGMMPTMWWQQMSFLPNMQMPTGDDFTMWATLYVAAFAGFLVALPFNYWLVARGAKRGDM